MSRTTYILGAVLAGLVLAVNLAGADTIQLTGTIRDFQDAHPDFQDFANNKVVTGLVTKTLGPNKKPVISDHFSESITSPESFAQWYSNTPGTNLSTSLTITLDNGKNVPGGIYTYEDSSFFPIDNQLYGNQGRSHNFHFTYELHTTFTYQGEEEFTFTGDDDLWVYINNTLVIDLGGTHSPASATIDLDTLGLVVGNVYSFDLFFAERRTSQSSFKVQTSIALQQNPALLERSPASLARTITQGQNAASQTFEVWNAGGGSLGYTLSDNVSWLSVSPTSGSSEGEHDTVTVTYSTAGLAASTYPGIITITAPGALGSPKTIPVTLTVNPVVAPAQLERSPASLIRTITQGQNAAAQTFEVWNAGGGSLGYTISDNASWLSVSPASGTSAGEHDTITVTYSTTGLAADTYTATITITAPGALGSPKTIAVTLTVNPVIVPAQLERSPAELSQSSTQGQNAQAQTFDVWNAGGGSLSYTISDNVSWLSVSPSSGSSTGEHDPVTVNYTSTGLAVGTYFATITVASPGAVGSPKTISVTLVVNAAGPAACAPLDFDGDGKSDIGAYHVYSGNWYIQNSGNGLTRNEWRGSIYEMPVAADYDGDCVTEVAVYNLNTGLWNIQISSTSNRMENLGFAGAFPVPGDYDGDGKADLAVFQSLTGDWYIKYSATGQLLIRNFGWYGVSPVPGDYDGDGKTDIAVYFSGNGTWYILQSASNTLRTQNWGWSAVVPIPADYDGDGKADIAVFHRAVGKWYILQSSNNLLRLQSWGWSAVVATPADYDGDGKADISVFHPASGNWYIQQSSTSQLRLQNWGWSQTWPVKSLYWIVGLQASP